MTASEGLRMTGRTPMHRDAPTKMPTPLSVFSPLTPQPHLREFIANLRADA